MYGARSMNTCTNILVSIWPTTSVAQATRHSEPGRGYAFSLRLSKGYKGQRPETNMDKLKGLNCDVIGFFGNQDRSPSPEMVTKFEADMQTAGKKLTAYKYEANHGFANPSNPSFNKEATADAHTKAIAFLKEHMR